jgi:hypothetical protein
VSDLVTTNCSNAIVPHNAFVDHSRLQDTQACLSQKKISLEATRLQDFLMPLNGLISLSLLLIPTVPSRSVQLAGLQTQWKIQ